MERKKLFGISLVVLLAVIGGAFYYVQSSMLVDSRGSVYQNVYNESYQAEKSEIIVLGTVSEDDGDRVTISVDETIKGPVKSSVRLWVRTDLASEASFENGEEVLVFVQEWEGHYQLEGQKYGKFDPAENQDLIEELREKYDPGE